jgi:hypothetical protein
MFGYDANTDNLSSSVTSGASAGATIQLGSDYVSGTYFESYNGTTPSGGCISNATMLSGFVTGYMVPTSASSMIIKTNFTGPTLSQKTSFYSDNGCGTLLGYHITNLKDIIVGPLVSNLNAGSASRPTSGYQVSYGMKDVITKAVTNDAATLTLLDSKNCSDCIAHTVNVEQTTVVTNSGTYKDLWAFATIGNNSWLYMGSPDISAHPTAWADTDAIMFK